MIVTLYLISTNVYNSVDAPQRRGFSYIELWMFISQFPILLALCEYGYVLLLKKTEKKNLHTNQTLNLEEQKPHLDEIIKRLDFLSMIISLTFFVFFASLYWIILFIKQNSN